MEMTGSEKMLQYVEAARQAAKAAERDYEASARALERKTATSMDLFSGSTLSKVGDIAADARNACDSLYAAYQTAVLLLDSQCRPLLQEAPTAEAVDGVRKMIKWLNEESRIGADFNASVNSKNIGTLVDVKYIPRMESKIIESFWEQTLRSVPGGKELLDKEAEDARKAEENRRKGQQMVRDIINEDARQTALLPKDASNQPNPAQEQQQKLQQLQKELEGLIRKQNQAVKKINAGWESFSADREKQLEQKRQALQGASRKQKADLREEIRQLEAQTREEEDRRNENLAQAQAERTYWEDQLNGLKKASANIDPKRGDTIVFGKDGSTPISWIVLQVAGDYVALISKEILGVGTFRPCNKGTCHIDWLRKFEGRAFSAEEKKLLLPARLTYEKGPAHAFVLTKADANAHLEPWFAADVSANLARQIGREHPYKSGDFSGEMKMKQALADARNRYWLYSNDRLYPENAHKVSRGNQDKWTVRTEKFCDDRTVMGIRPAILLDRKKLAESVVLPSKFKLSEDKVEKYRWEIIRKQQEEKQKQLEEQWAQEAKATKRNTFKWLIPLVGFVIGFWMLLDALVCGQSFVWGAVILAVDIALTVFLLKKKFLSLGWNQTMKVFCIALVVTVGINGIQFLRLMPLRESLKQNQVVEGTDLRYDKSALKLVAARLSECQKQNDVVAALELITDLAGHKVNNQIPYSDDHSGYYLACWYSYAEWLYEEIKPHGERLQNRKNSYIDYTFEYNGYQIGFYASYQGDITGFEVYVPGYRENDGWFEMDCSYYDFGNVTYHNQKGGVMVPNK